MLEQMKTNTGITIYHKYYDEKEHIDKWKLQTIENVMWQGGLGASLNKGYDQANNVNVYIPLNNVNGVEISIGDILVKGILTEEIKKQSDLTESYNITTKIQYDYGSSKINHLQIGAR